MMSNWYPVLGAACWAILLGGIGGALTEVGAWYAALRKPAWQPPDWVFGPVWTVILGLAAWTSVIGWRAASTNASYRNILIVYGVNFLCHLAWSPLFFKLRRPDWALIEVMFLWASIVAMIVVLAPLSALAAWLLAPYIVWVMIAAALNRAVVRLNQPFAA